MPVTPRTAAHGKTPDPPADDPAAKEIEVFYDGDCPLCRREVALLRRWDKQQRVAFTDIAARDFDPAAVGRDMPTLMAEIHGRLPDGQIVTGVEVFRRVYSALGWNRLVAVTRWPGVGGLLSLLYRGFARNRLRLTGRCGTAGTCRLDR